MREDNKMATSARLASLLEQRRASRGLYSGDKIRVLSPSSNSGISTIARRNISAETDEMIKRYNDGLIGNEDMKAFLNKQVGNAALTPQEKVDIQDKIRDFDTLIQKDKLESVYKSAPDGSFEKIQAAQTLSDFYKKRASGMVAGTPAHSQALENAGVWDQTVADLNVKANRAGQVNLQRQLQQNINTLPTSSSQRSLAEADMYKKLFETSTSQGDQEMADKYAAAYNQAITMANQHGNTETEQLNKQKIKEYIASADLEISKLKTGSAAELAAKRDKAQTVAEMYRQIGDSVNYTHFMSVATEAGQKFDSKVAGNAKAEMKAEVDVQLNELKKLESDYKNGKKITLEDGTTGLITGLALADAKDSAYRAITNYYQQGIDAGITGLEGELVKYQGLLDSNARELSSWQNGDKIDVVGKNGVIMGVDVSNPEVKQKYVEGVNGIYHKLERPVSNIPGASQLTSTELRDYINQGRAYVPVDEKGLGSDTKGNPIFRDQNGNWQSVSVVNGVPQTDEKGQLILTGPTYYPPKYATEQFVDVPTPTGTQRIWSQHDETGALKGWLPETASTLVGAEKTNALLSKPEDYNSYLIRTNNASTPNGPINAPAPVIKTSSDVPSPIPANAPNTSTKQGAVYTPPQVASVQPSQPSSQPNATSVATKQAVSVPAPTFSSQPAPSAQIKLATPVPTQSVQSIQKPVQPQQNVIQQAVNNTISNTVSGLGNLANQVKNLATNFKPSWKFW